MNHSFIHSLINGITAKKSACVVGLDPDFSLMPRWLSSHYEQPCAEGLYDFCKLVIDAVSEYVPVVKPQSAYFEVYGSAGIAALERTVLYAKSKDLLVLLDAKRGDIGSTSAAYARAYLARSASGLSVDAMTLNPYLGPDSLQPFVKQAYESGTGIFICTMTSNPGAAHLQHLSCDRKPLFHHVADMVASFVSQASLTNGYSPVGIVAGATYPHEAALLRQVLPNSFFLVPGMGVQGGDAALLGHFFDKDGLGAIVSSSRAILYPVVESSDVASYTLLARDAALSFIKQVNLYRSSK